MLGRVVNKTAVITGAASGIGRQTAKLFAREGAKAVVCADRNEGQLQETIDEINEAHGKEIAHRFVVDVSQEQQVQDLMQFTKSKWGKLDILFNNAGVMDLNDDDAINTSEETWDKTMKINVKGVFFGCKYGIPLMKQSGGAIINTASFVASVGAATPQLAYTASKGAVLSLSRELAVLHAREKIRINSLCPGPLNTPLLQAFLDTKEKQQRRLVHVPMGRFGEAAEMAKAVLFLASDDASYITGHAMAVDGGLTAAYVTPDTPDVDPFSGPSEL